MNNLADRITAALRILIGQPISNCWRAADMHIFEFGPRRQTTNHKGEPIEVSDLRLHVQCRWRFVDADRILFGRDDLLYPADTSIPHDEFDWGQQESVADVLRRRWFDQHGEAAPVVTSVQGERYGGFRIELSSGFALETFPCDSRRGEHSEHWRLIINDSPDSNHFVVCGYGIEGVDEQVHDDED